MDTRDRDQNTKNRDASVPTRHLDHAARLRRLDGLETATRERFGAESRGVRLPARLVVDFDPWALGLEMTVTALSVATMRASIDLTGLPSDTRHLFAGGDLFRIQLDTAGQASILPLMTARLEPDQSGDPSVQQEPVIQLRFKWLLDHAAERELQKFILSLETDATDSDGSGIGLQ